MSKEIYDNEILDRAMWNACDIMKKDNFTAPTKQNPLMNVTLPEIKYNPKRKSAAPSFNPQVEKEINENSSKIWRVKIE